MLPWSLAVVTNFVRAILENEPAQNCRTKARLLEFTCKVSGSSDSMHARLAAQPCVRGR